MVEMDKIYKNNMSKQFIEALKFEIYRQPKNHENNAEIRIFDYSKMMQVKLLYRFHTFNT